MIPMRNPPRAVRSVRGPDSPSRRRWIVRVGAGLAAIWLPRAGAATTYPSRVVRFIVGRAAGGPTDVIARIVAQEFGERWNQPVVVENRPGAAGTIAAHLVVQAPADGYTLLVGSNGPIASAPAEMENPPYDPLRAWAPVGRIARSGYVLAVRRGLKATTVQEFVALAKAGPESVSMASAGPGSNSLLPITLLERAAGVRFLNVPYNGGAPQIQAVVSGEVDATFSDVAVVLPFAASGALRLLATCSRQRIAHAPDLPTFVESGFPGVVTEAWYGIVAPAGTPAAVIAELVSTLHSTLADADVHRRFDALGCEAVVETPDEFAAAIRFEYDQARALAEPKSRRP